MEEPEDEITLSLNLSLDEVNQIMSILSEQPFKDVFEIIGKINAQANDQLTQENNERA
ncbi:MAG: hypothetical protein ACPG5P_00490 [Saprospiraceae bacterium]